MSWAKIDDRANEHRKQLDAGAEACWLWACGLMYANRQPARDGFIPERMLGLLYPFMSATKLAKALVRVGLWDKAPGGYLIHEFTKWNQSREQVEAERKNGRARAAKSYEKKKPKKRKSSGEEKPKTGGKESASETGEELPKSDDSSPPRAHTGAGIPSASSPPALPLPATTAPDPEQPQPCPADLQLSEAQIATLATGGISVPEWAIVAITQKFVAKAVADQADLRTLVSWRKCLAAAVTGDWRDPSKKPKKPDVDSDGMPKMELPAGVRFGAEGL